MFQAMPTPLLLVVMDSAADTTGRVPQYAEDNALHMANSSVNPINQDRSGDYCEIANGLFDTPVVNWLRDANGLVCADARPGCCLQPGGWCDYLGHQ